MSVIKIRNEQGIFVDIPIIKGEDGVSITEITSESPIENEDYTVTPITFKKSDSTSQTINVSAKNGSGGSSTNNPWKLLHQIDIAEQVGQIIYNFENDYDYYYVKGTLNVGEGGTLVIYQPIELWDGKNSNLKFLDTYGNNGKTVTLSLMYERIKTENGNLLRLSGIYTNANYLAGNKMTLIDTGYVYSNDNGELLKRYKTFNLTGEFLSGSLMIFGGNL